MKIKLECFFITTADGKITSLNDKLPFLTKDEVNEVISIGYTGKDSKGETTSTIEYLNSLDKGTFKIVQTKVDTGDFIEEFILVRATLEGEPNLAQTLFQSEIDDELKAEFKGESDDDIRAEREGK